MLMKTPGVLAQLTHVIRPPHNGHEYGPESGISKANLSIRDS